MPISGTRRLMQTAPKLDVKSPVFYAPLWRPDMVASGGSIVNGTGTMDVSPQSLAVGANTITVTAAGTLIVNMPEGGTVASGTMTVTGSPVTVSAGIATTITTTGAIGNITCTPSNIIRSKDKNNYALTVIGATWGSQGRTTDGNDYIEATATALDFTTSDFTILMWLYPTTLLGDSRLLFCRGVYQTDGYRVYLAADGRIFLETNQAGAEQSSNAPLSSIVINQWQLLGVTRAGAVGKLWVDAVDKTTVSASHTNPLTSARTLKIGVADDTINDFYIGIIGEVALWNRDLGQSGIAQFRQATKWRYY